MIVIQTKYTKRKQVVWQGFVSNEVQLFNTHAEIINAVKKTYKNWKCFEPNIRMAVYAGIKETLVIEQNDIGTPDLIMIEEKEHRTIYAEIKPDRLNFNLIREGIGQAITYLLFGKESVLICSYKWEDTLKKIYKLINNPLFQILMFDNKTGKFYYIGKNQIVD